MSAIFGILQLNHALDIKLELNNMKKIIGHYGTDEQEIYVDGAMGFGCCLRKLTTYSQEDTPIYMDSNQERILVGDAVIYNREELIRSCQLEEDSVITTQRLLMETYLLWGEHCAKHINGDFTFAIWEKEKQNLILFRDHLGVRPIYYYYDCTIFAFSTDYRALLALPFVEDNPDKTLLYAVLSDTYHIDTQSTLYENIKRLPQAHSMEINARGITKKKYWTPGVEQKIILPSEEEYAKALYTLVEDSIRIRIKGIIPTIASEFSGGLDSSVVTILANSLLKNQGKTMIAYSWSPSHDLMKEVEKDERDIMEALSDREGFVTCYRAYYQTPEETVRCQPALTDGQRSEELRQIMHEMQLQGIGMVLSGWGGDEGISHRADLPELYLSGDVRHFFKECRYLTKGSLLRFIKLILLLPITILCRPYSFLGKQNKTIPVIMKKKFQKREKKHCKKDILNLKVNPVKHLESGVTVSRTEITALIGADYHIQYLFPYLDYRVIDFAMSIPRHLYYKYGEPRYIYRKAFESVLPQEICTNRSKIDPSREQYWKETEDLQKKAEIVYGLIDKARFASYIDWNKVEDLIKRDYFREPSRGSIYTLLKLMICYDLQKIAESTKGDHNKNQKNNE